MKVKEVMMGTPYYCQPETNLGSATELMWNANCGFLPVATSEGKVIGVVTDRDICIALGTRGQLAGDISVGEVMSDKLHSCVPDEDIHIALQTMKDGKVRRLPGNCGERYFGRRGFHGRYIAARRTNKSGKTSRSLD